MNRNEFNWIENYVNIPFQTDHILVTKARK